MQVLQKLKTARLRHGRETAPIPPVSDKLVEQTLPHLSAQIADMVRIQRLTGMRPSELVIMRTPDIDRSREVWLYTPQDHKNKHRGKSRNIYIGPKAQALLAPYLLKAEDFLFPSGRAERYTPDSYRRVVHRACKRHRLTKWSPHQLRKAAPTQVRSTLDVESVASLLGHSSATVTGMHYAAADQRRAIEAAMKLG